ncbi:MAG: NYN domain-containing protein, partial [Anaerolineae bacterium]|nr:NYN domain-containing protein [Anaerolineae bacterium]
ATDMELVIDAMDMMYKKYVNAFCIVSSDSDFTSLCRRIREEKLMVFGVGKKQTPDAFLSSCYQFFYIEDIEQGVYDAPKPISPAPKTSTKSPNDAIPLIRQALAQLQNSTEWVHLGGLGNALKKSNFQSSDYGHKKLLTLIKALPHHFAIKNEGTIVYVSLKKSAQ